MLSGYSGDYVSVNELWLEECVNNNRLEAMTPLPSPNSVHQSPIPNASSEGAAKDTPYTNLSLTTAECEYSYEYTPLLAPVPTAVALVSLFAGVWCSASQLSPTRREFVSALMQYCGGVYTKDLVRKVTHLVCERAEDAKFRRSKAWGIKCVTAQWLIDCVQRGAVLPANTARHSVGGDNNTYTDTQLSTQGTQLHTQAETQQPNVDTQAHTHTQADIQPTHVDTQAHTHTQSDAQPSHVNTLAHTHTVARSQIPMYTHMTTSGPKNNDNQTTQSNQISVNNTNIRSPSRNPPTSKTYTDNTCGQSNDRDTKPVARQHQPEAEFIDLDADEVPDPEPSQVAMATEASAINSTDVSNLGGDDQDSTPRLCSQLTKSLRRKMLESIGTGQSKAGNRDNPSPPLRHTRSSAEKLTHNSQQAHPVRSRRSTRRSMDTKESRKHTRGRLERGTDTDNKPKTVDTTMREDKQVTHSKGLDASGLDDGDWDAMGSDLVKGLEPKHGRHTTQHRAKNADHLTYAYDVDELSRDSLLAGVVVHVVTGEVTSTTMNKGGSAQKVPNVRAEGLDTTAKWYDLAERMGAKCVYDYIPPSKDANGNTTAALRSSSINRTAPSANESTNIPGAGAGATKPTHILAFNDTGACVREAVRVGKQAMALVVQGEWLTACYDQRKRLEVTKYLLACNGQLTRTSATGRSTREPASIHNPRPPTHALNNAQNTSVDCGDGSTHIKEDSQLDKSGNNSNPGSFKAPSKGSSRQSASGSTTEVNSRANSPTSQETNTEVDVTLSQKIGEMFKRLPSQKKRKISATRKVLPTRTGGIRATSVSFNGTKSAPLDTETSSSTGQLVALTHTSAAEDTPKVLSELGDSGDVVYDDTAGREKINRLRDDRRKANARFHLSAFTTEEKNKMINILKPLGIKVIQGDIYEPSCTHLVVKTPSGSEKFLAACAAGIWVLRMGYIIECFQQQRMVDELPYIWSDNNRSTTKNSLSDEQWNLAKSYAHWRVAIQKQRDNGLPVGAFVGWKVLLRTNKDSVLRRMMAAGGGAVIEDASPYTDDSLKRARYLFVDEKYDGDVDVSRFQMCGVECLRPEYMFHYLLEAPNLPILDNYRVKPQDRSATVSPREGSPHPRTHTTAKDTDGQVQSTSGGSRSSRQRRDADRSVVHTSKLVGENNEDELGQTTKDTANGINLGTKDTTMGDKVQVDGVSAARRTKRTKGASENGTNAPKRPRMKGV